MNGNYAEILERVAAASARAGHPARVLAVSKTKPAAAIRALAALGQRAFGENYVQEALVKQAELIDWERAELERAGTQRADVNRAEPNQHGLNLEWHLIGPLQSNKCREVALHFDWLQSLDRGKLIEPLNRYRDAARPPLNVLIQVNIDAEPSKSGCAPAEVPRLAHEIAQAPRLRLRGLMAIPQPAPDAGARREAFGRMRALYAATRATFPQMDTLSMGMSDDFELAIESGASMVRIGTALFGARA